MDMMRKILVLLVVAIAGVLWAPVASAQCGTSLAFSHILGSYVQGCADDRPLDAIVAAFGASGTTGTSNVVCESADEQNIQGGRCQVAAGTVGDGRVTISGNFANPGAVGTCPNPGPAPGVGRNVYALRDHNGGGVIISTGYDNALGVYAIENSHTADTSLDPLPLSCSPKGTDASGLATGAQTMRLESVAGAPPTGASLTLRHPKVFSDCDPDSVGMLRNTGSCDPGVEVGSSITNSGNVLVTTGPCGGVQPAKSICNGGNKADQACTANLDCVAPASCIAHWTVAGTADPASLPATLSVPLPTSACKGGNNPDVPCTTSAQCAGRCAGGARNTNSCTASTFSVCGGSCSTDPTFGCTVLNAACAPPGQPAGVCQGRCSGNPAQACTVSTQCTAGTCTISAFPCALGTCSPLNSAAFTNQCLFLGNTLTFNDAFGTPTESTSIMSVPIILASGGPGAPSARALDVRAAASSGSVKVSFRTAAELQLIGFNVLTETKAKGTFKVNDTLIAPRGVGGGGATYTDIVIPRGKFQGGKTVIIESVLSDNTTLRSDPAQF